MRTGEHRERAFRIVIFLQLIGEEPQVPCVRAALPVVRAGRRHAELGGRARRLNRARVGWLDVVGIAARKRELRRDRDQPRRESLGKAAFVFGAFGFAALRVRRRARGMNGSEHFGRGAALEQHLRVRERFGRAALRDELVERLDLFEVRLHSRLADACVRPPAQRFDDQLAGARALAVELAPRDPQLVDDDLVADALDVAALDDARRARASRQRGANHRADLEQNRLLLFGPRTGEALGDERVLAQLGGIRDVAHEMADRAVQRVTAQRRRLRRTVRHVGENLRGTH